MAKVLLLVVTASLILVSLVLPGILHQQSQQLEVGQVAVQEVLAPYSISYESKVLTERARKEAAAAINPVYMPSDPNIARAQLEILNDSFYYLSTVRQDALATLDQKLSDIEALTTIPLTPENAQIILELDDEIWKSVRKESTRVLEQTLRESIRNDGVAQARANLPAMVDFSFPNEQVGLIADLLSPLVVPTSLFNEELTNQQREQARSMIDPISRQVISGEILLQRGQIVRQEELEVLDAYGLAKAENLTEELIRDAVLVAIALTIATMYLQRHSDKEFSKLRSLILISMLVLLFLGVARFLVIDRTVLPYLYPLAAFGLTIAIVFDVELSIILSLILSILTVSGSAREGELAIFYILPTLGGILSIGKAKRMGSFFVAGLVTSLLSIAVVVTFRLGDTRTDLMGFTSLIAAAGFNGLASASLAMLLQYISSQVLDAPTQLQLLDIARPDHPLLQYVLRNAPGTYQHSLLVSNLAEQAAEAIGADRLLVRAGTIFHDCGKANNPQFFIENQVKDKIDSHDDLEPALAAATIIAHVTDGIALAKRYRLPSRVIDFIREHHGTLMTRYQYTNALNQAEKTEDVDKSMFTYPGPAPRSRETAILMLADGTEARTRAESPRTEKEIRDLIKATIDYCKNENQLDNTDLTLRDLTTIADSFYETLQRSYHPRIKYPEIKPADSQTTQDDNPVELSETENNADA
ncbi:MAG: HD family phosphohydrolase [Anaerolineaceae bacterium]